jgi:hypothetical protein
MRPFTCGETVLNPCLPAGRGTLPKTKKPHRLGLSFCGEYRSRTGDLLHAMQAVYPPETLYRSLFLRYYLTLVTQT